jgi:hypothetical protein
MKRDKKKKLTGRTYFVKVSLIGEYLKRYLENHFISLLSKNKASPEDSNKTTPIKQSIIYFTSTLFPAILFSTAPVFSRK